jgi:hypothetical protein
MAKKMARRPAKKAVKKSAARKVVKKPSRPKTKSRPAKASGRGRVAWFAADGHKPLISEHVQRLTPFLKAMEDGRIDQAEVDAQEKRLIAAMKDIEPRLNGEMHGKVTRLLCEMAAYDLMQALHAVQANRPQTVFRG